MKALYVAKGAVRTTTVRVDALESEAYRVNLEQTPDYRQMRYDPLLCVRSVLKEYDDSQKRSRFC